MVELLAPSNRFVAMFDIIGFKGLRQKIGTDGLYQLFDRSIRPGIQHSAAGRGRSIELEGRSVYVPDVSDISVQYRFISDTVIFFTRDDTFPSFLNIVNSSIMLLKFGFGGGKAPYRGALGWGDLIASEDVLVGTAVEDAYLGEASQVWAGAMLTNACRDFAVQRSYCGLFRQLYLMASAAQTDETQKRILLDQARILTEYDVPTQINPKDGPITYSTFRTYAFDWTLRMFEGAGAKSFETSSNPHALKIAANTAAFETWARANNR